MPFRCNLIHKRSADRFENCTLLAVLRRMDLRMQTTAVVWALFMFSHIKLRLNTDTQTIRIGYRALLATIGYMFQYFTLQCFAVRCCNE